MDSNGALMEVLEVVFYRGFVILINPMVFYLCSCCFERVGFLDRELICSFL
jgi:hypothetical protein